MSKPDGQKAEQPPLIVPAWVFDQGFNKYHIIVLCYVAMRRKCWENKKTIAKVLGIKPETLKRTLNELVESGWLTKTTKKVNPKLANSHCYKLSGDGNHKPQKGRSIVKHKPDVSPIERMKGKRPQRMRVTRLGEKTNSLGPMQVTGMEPQEEPSLEALEEPTLAPAQDPKLHKQHNKITSQDNDSNGCAPISSFKEAEPRSGECLNHSNFPVGPSSGTNCASQSHKPSKKRPVTECPHQRGSGDWMEWMIMNGHHRLVLMDGFSHMQGKPQSPKPPTKEKWGATQYQMDSFAKAVALYNKNWNTNFTLKEAEREYFRQMDDKLSA